MLKPDPNAKRMRILGVICILAGMLNIGVSVLDEHSSVQGFYAQWGWAPALLIVLGGVSMLVGAYRTRRRLEPQRQLASAGVEHSTKLARHQPEWDANALSLPTTIAATPRWTLFLVLALVDFAIMLCVSLIAGSMDSGVLSRLSSHAHHHVQLVTIVVIAFAQCILIALIIGYALYRKLRWRIDVSDDGLRVLTSGRRASIRWDEATLFAITAIARTRKPMPPVLYELAGPHNVVQWVVTPPGRARRFLKPSVSWEEYDRQMDALLSVVAAHTHLPLYDLREPPKHPAPSSEVPTRDIRDSA